MRRLAALLAVVAVVASASRANASGAPVAPRLVGAPSGEVRAGQIVDLVWTATSSDVEELEFLLALDGEHFRTRISPTLDPATRRWRWRVPNLAAERAAIRLRFGTEREEIETPPTATFRIVRDAATPPARLGFSEGYVWDPRDDDAGVPAPGWTVPGASLGVTRLAGECDEPDPSPAPTSFARTRTERPRHIVFLPQAALTPSDRSPEFVPARI